jgi:hypothetical protein
MRTKGKCRNFMFLRAKCWFFVLNSLDVFYVGPRIIKMQFLIKNFFKLYRTTHFSDF